MARQESVKLLSPAGRPGTISDVTIEAIRPASDVAKLLRGESVTIDPAAMNDTLLTAARLVALELDALRASSAGDAGRIAVEVHRLAVAGGVAAAGAIGVTCVLAGHLRRPDHRELAATLCRARAAFTDRELLDGAAAVCGAACSRLAESFDLDPAEVAALVDAVAQRHAARCGAPRLRRPATLERCRRPSGPQSVAS